MTMNDWQKNLLAKKHCNTVMMGGDWWGSDEN